MPKSIKSNGDLVKGTVVLKKCPFCGGEAHIYQDSSREFKVVCSSCNASVPAQKSFYLAGYDDALKSAEEAWNART